MQRRLAPNVEGTVKLADGRRLGFAEFGAPRGQAVFWFHGTPGGRRQVPLEAREMAAARDVRLIGVDRPGIGASSRHLYKSVSDWSVDIEHLADRLGFERFAVVGMSGGGPYTLACAHALPQRVAVAAVLGGVAPARGGDAVPGGLVALAARFEPLLRHVHRPIGAALTAAIWPLRPFASPLFNAFAAISPAADRIVFARPDIKAMFLDDLLRGSRTNLSAPICDLLLFSRDWGFPLAEIRVPVRIWHGDADHMVPIAHGHWLAARIPGAVIRVRPGESHLGGLGAAAEVLDTILEVWSAKPVPEVDVGA